MNLKKILLSLRTRVTVTLIFSMVFIGALSNFFVYNFSLSSQFLQLRNKLRIIAQTAALIIEPEELKKIPLKKEGISSKEFKHIAGQLLKIRKANPALSYVYIMSKTEKEGILQFIVDPEPNDGKERATSYPGDIYDAQKFPEMLKAFEGSTADNELGEDAWGMLLSGYAPIRDHTERAIAILGVDIKADDVKNYQKKIHQRAIIVFFIGIIISIFISIFLSKRITQPVQDLVRATHHIAKGNLDYLVEMKGADDEIRRLVRSFNAMALRLKRSRKKLYNYFYQMMQSFVQLIEAKDKYTRGHSERVSEYAEKIAVRMGLSPEQQELLKHSALLHDIGKLGIDLSILHKKEKLSAEEWKTLKEHPVLGEQIVKPIALNRQMLEIIKAHHERYDGTGYPEKIDKNKISLLSSIVSIADAYDAMTSNRPYRRALGKKKAIEELKNNSGSQFNPAVVEIFLEILEEEKKHAC